MPTPLPLPDDLLPLHVAVVEADVDAARAAYVDQVLALRAHPIWEEARTAACYAQTWQASLDAAKTMLDSEQAAA